MITHHNASLTTYTPRALSRSKFDQRHGNAFVRLDVSKGSWIARLGVSCAVRCTSGIRGDTSFSVHSVRLPFDLSRDDGSGTCSSVALLQILQIPKEDTTLRVPHDENRMFEGLREQGKTHIEILTGRAVEREEDLETIVPKCRSRLPFAVNVDSRCG